jgi:hypothetical protein
LDALEGQETEALTVERMRRHKEDMFRLLLETAEESDLDELSEPIMAMLEQQFETPDVERLRGAVVAWEEDLVADMAVSEAIGGDSFFHHIEMPGILVDTNAFEVVGNRASWQFDAHALDLADMEMWVESRVSNPTAVWISAIAALAIVVLLVVSAVRGRAARMAG